MHTRYVDKDVSSHPEPERIGGVEVALYGAGFCSYRHGVSWFTLTQKRLLSIDFACRLL